MMERRQFLGAAAALAALPATTTAAASDDREEFVEREPEIVEGDTHEESAFLELYDDADGAAVTVRGHLHQESQPVSITLQFDSARASTGFEPETARSLARDLLEAADAAEAYDHD